MKKHITKARPNHRFASFINKRTIEARNSDTKKFLYHLELNQKVERYAQGGRKIFLPEHNRFTAYVPDFSVVCRDKNQVVFIDRKLELTNYTITKLTNAYGKHQEEFVRILPAQIHQQPYLENAEFLYRYAWEPINIEHKFAVLDFFQKHVATTIEHFQLFLQSRGLSKSSVFALIFRNRLKIDIHKKIDENSVLRIGEIQEVSI